MPAYTVVGNAIGCCPFRTAQNLGLELLIIEAGTVEEIDVAFASAVAQHAMQWLYLLLLC